MKSWFSSFFDNKILNSKVYLWKKDNPDFRDRYLEHKKHELLKFNTSCIDLRDKCPKIYNQGSLGSCTANSIAAAYEFDMIKQKESNIFTPSRLFIYYNERDMENTINYDSGAQIRDGMRSINKIGICPEKLWPYNINKYTYKPSHYLYDIAKKHRSILYSRVQQNLNDLKLTLSKGYPIIFGFSVYESFESKSVAEKGIMTMPKQNEKLLGGHAVLAVGFNDETKTFIVRNSWGTTWGDSGYFYMPFEYITNKNLASDFWVLERVKDLE